MDAGDRMQAPCDNTRHSLITVFCLAEHKWSEIRM